MTELSGLFNQSRSSQTSVAFLFLWGFITFPLLSCAVFSSSIAFLPTSIFILFLPSSLLALSPSFTWTSWTANLPPCLSLAPSLLSLSCFHSHTLSLFPSIGFNSAKFCEEPLAAGPLGDQEMTEGGLYLPLWPPPCRLLNHVANRQHCLPARPHPDNGEPHSYLIQWSV